MGSVLKHQHPKFLFQFPRLIYLSYGLNWLIRLRKWYIHNTLVTILKSTNTPFCLVDIGVGDGQFFIPLAKKHSASNFIGVDTSESNIALLNRLAEKEKITNITAVHASVEELTLKPKADIVLCMSVLQYIENDTAALRNIFELCNNKAKLILYVPINERFVTTLYKYLFTKLPNYESVNNRKRVYTKNEIIEKLKIVGFTIEQSIPTYGFWGILSHELFSSLYLIIIHSNLILKIIGLLLIPFLLPFIWAFMFIDYHQKKETGNGLLIVAKKD